MAEVVFDKEYLASWDGVVDGIEMRRVAEDEGATEMDKLVALVNYYSKAVKNLDEIKESLGGGNVPFEQVVSVINEALAADAKLKK